MNNLQSLTQLTICTSYTRKPVTIPSRYSRAGGATMSERCERSFSPGEVLAFAYLGDGLAIFRGGINDGEQSVPGQLPIKVQAYLVDPEFGELKPNLKIGSEHRWQAYIERHLNDSGGAEYSQCSLPTPLFRDGSQIDPYINWQAAPLVLHFDLEVKEHVLPRGEGTKTQELHERPQGGAIWPSDREAGEQNGETAHLVPFEGRSQPLESTLGGAE